MGLYEKLHRDFALRTKANLEYIQNAWNADEPNVFNVTQLINSCLGMIVFIKECEYLPTCPIHEFNEGIIFDTLHDKNNSNNSFRDFIRRFRNAISHCRIEAYGTHQDIEGFELKDGPNGNTNWHIKIEIDSIEALALALVDYVVENAPPRQNK
jgi:hypothetical protein